MTAPVISRKVVNPANAYLVRQRLTKWSPATNSFVPWTGASLTVEFSTDELGASPISGMTSIPLTAATQAGIYYAEVSAATMNLLIPYEDQVVYQTVTGGPANEYKAVTALYVERPRWAQ